MAGSMEEIRRLTEDIGARPASTEEEYYAASNLEKRFRSHGLQAGIDDFTVPMFANLGFGIAYVLIGLLAILTRFGGVVAVVLTILTILLVVIVVIERLGRSIILTASRSGRSQNVIGRHPAQAPLTGSTPKPVVIVAHYDSGRTSLLGHPAIAPHRNKIRYLMDAAIILIPIFLILSLIPAFPEIARNIFQVVSLVLAIPLIVIGLSIVISHFFMPYAPGANDNASGVAALLGVLNRVRSTDGSGRDDRTDEEADPGEGAVEDRPKRMRRGAAIARAVGVVSSATLIEYIERETPVSQPDDEEDEYDSAEWFIDEEKSSETCEIPVFSTFDPDRTSVDRSDDQDSEKPANAGYRFRIPHVTDLIDGTEQFEAIKIPAEPNLPVMSQPSPPLISAPRESEPGQTEMFPVLDEASVDVPEPDVPSEQPLPRMFEEADRAFQEERERKEVEKAAEEPLVKRSRFADLPVDFRRPEPTAEPEPQAVPDPVLPEETPLEEVREEESLSDTSEAPTPELIIEQQSSREPEAEMQTSISMDETIQYSMIPDIPESIEEMEEPDVGPQWGTTQFLPREHLVLLDVPDPSVAAVDPFSVSNVQPVGVIDPNDFSSQDFATGTFAALETTSGQVDEMELDVPSDSFFSRMGDRIGSIFGSKKKGTPSHTHRRREKEEDSLGEWLDLEDGFDAKSAGKDIGTWENFNGSSRDEGDWRGGGTTRRVIRQGEPPVRETEDAAAVRDAIFRLGDADLVEKEIWFVATGASEFCQSGMRDFLDRYERDLSGCTIINLECVGAGELSVITSEGRGIPTPADRRLVTLAKRAGRAISVRIGEGKIHDRDTDAASARSRGHRALTLMGLERGAPVNSRWTTDTIENIEPSSIDDAVDVVTEIIRRL